MEVEPISAAVGRFSKLQLSRPEQGARSVLSPLFSLQSRSPDYRNLLEKQRVLELVVDTPSSCLGLISMLSRSRRIKRSFQWLSVILAGALLAIGLVLMTFDVVELEPWNVQQRDTPNVLTSLLLGAFGLFLACAALWAIVKPLGGSS